MAQRPSCIRAWGCCLFAYKGFSQVPHLQIVHSLTLSFYKPLLFWGLEEVNFIFIMGLFSFLTNKKMKISELFDISREWTDVYLKQNPKRVNSKLFQAEIFMFNAWAAFFYCHNENKIKNEDPFEFVESLYSHINNIVDLDRTYFDTLLEIRLKLYKGEIISLLKSDYPRTKQFLPFDLYCALEENPLKHNPTLGVNYDDFSTSIKLEEWLDVIIDHWNFIMKDIRKKC